MAALPCRRIKRSRRHGARDGSGSSDSEDSGCEGGSESGSDDEAGEEVCPPGCEPGLYERVVELRGRRLDEEEAGGEVGKALEGIRKERELLGKKARLLEQALAAVNQVRGLPLLLLLVLPFRQYMIRATSTGMVCRLLWSVRPFVMGDAA